jgi:uncharacterized protein
MTALDELLHSLDPVLSEGVFAYVCIQEGEAPDGLRVIASIREAEGLTLIVSEADAVRAHLPILFRAAWITLQVHSQLEAVGLTAAVSRALADAGISCNVVAGTWHDHLFVPIAEAGAALERLRRLQQTAR